MTTTEWMVLVGGLGLAAALIALFRAMLGSAYDAGFEDGYTARICGRKRSKVKGQTMASRLHIHRRRRREAMALMGTIVNGQSHAIATSFS